MLQLGTPGFRHQSGEIGKTQIWGLAVSGIARLANAFHGGQQDTQAADSLRCGSGTLERNCFGSLRVPAIAAAMELIIFAIWGLCVMIVFTIIVIVLLVSG